MDNFAFGMFTEEEEYTARQECNAYHDMLDHECDYEFFELSEECDISDYEDNYLSGEEDFA